MNTMSQKSRIASLFFAILATTALISCNNAYGIYSSVQEEKPGPSLGPFYRATVGEVVAFGNDLWARRSTLAKKSTLITGSSWATVSVGSLGSSYTSVGLAASTTTLYAGIQAPDSTQNGIYSLGISGSTWSFFKDSLIESVFVANGTVFVLNHDEMGTPAYTSDDIWTLATFDGTTLTPLSLSVALGTPILSIVWDGTAYWVLTPAGLYTSATAGGSFALTGETGAPSNKLASIAVGSSGVAPYNLYVGTTDGKVYVRKAPAWLAAPLTATSSSYSVTALIEVPAGASPQRLIAGFGGSTSGAGGYVEFDTSTWAVSAGGDSSAVLSLTTSYDTNLAGKPVNGFYLLNGSLFAAVAGGVTGSSGLYRDDYSAPSWSGWASE